EERSTYCRFIPIR
ncbi:polysaccharide biosynthesis/export family protein, partial [Vibrio harveyi]